MTKIGIIGCGWLGEKLAETLCPEYSIYSTTTSLKKFERLKSKGFNPFIVNFGDNQTINAISKWKELENLNVVIITVPFSEKKLSSTQLLAKMKSLSLFLDAFKGQMFFMSSTSVYPDNQKNYEEVDLPAEKVFAEQLIKSFYPQINILRLAGLMGDDRLLMNYNVSDLNHPVNHIHYADVCEVIKSMIKLNSESKLFNLVAPLHPTKQQVISAQKNEAYQMIQTVNGRRISCNKLTRELAFKFKYPDPRLFHLKEK